MPNGGKVGTWSSKTNDKSQWIQVDLGDVKRVTQVASQGQALYGYVQWITEYRVSYSTLGKEFKSQVHVSHVGIMEPVHVLVVGLFFYYVITRNRAWHIHANYVG